MRFPQLAIGQRFRYQGKLFSKSGPLTAREEGSGNNRLIRKSAQVELFDDAAAPPKRAHEPLQRQHLEDAMARIRHGAEQATGGDGRMPVGALLSLVEEELEAILMDLS